MSTARESIDSELKTTVLPWLREAGFRGSFPHFRRRDTDGIDLVTFQFDRHGGGFVIEVARCPPDGVTTHWGKQISPARVTAHDMHPNDRTRLKPRPGSGTDSWFRYDRGQFKECAALVVAVLRDSRQVSRAGTTDDVVPSA